MSQNPLDLHQQELVNVVKAAHQNLAIARKVKSAELVRRITASRLKLQQAFDKAIEVNDLTIRLDLDAEVEQHAATLDRALIAAYNEGIPIRRIALDGFGNRYDGGVQQLLVKLREDGRLGNRLSYQRTGSSDPTESLDVKIEFPKPLDLDTVLAENTVISAPTFTLIPVPLVLVSADENGENGISVPAVRLDMDPRDPWFASIAKNARPGSQYLRATYCTLYEHPATGNIVTFESKETGEMAWDHPVSRWVKSNPDAAREGFRGALETSE